MIADANGVVIEDRAVAYAAIKSGEIACQMCGGRATDLHNHREDAEAWEALCSMCHAEVEARECGWTPIGALAVRYADTVRSKNQLNNRLLARRRLGWDSLETDLWYPMTALQERRKYLGKILDQQAKRHPMYAWLDGVQGVGPRAAALLIAVMERAFAQGITSVRNQRKYFGFIPDQDQKYHHTCKWLISQALGPAVQTKKGLFGELYDEYRAEVKDTYEKKAHQHNYAMARVMREFLKSLCLVWREYEGLENGNRHPEDAGPQPVHWVA